VKSLQDSIKKANRKMSSKMNAKTAGLSAAAVIAGFLGACQKPTPFINSMNATDSKTQNIFADRPNTPDQLTMVIKLKNPAVLSTSQRIKGKTVVDADLLKAVNAEHAEALAQLQKISPEIKVIYAYKMVLNGLTVVAPSSLVSAIENLAGGPSQVVRAKKIARPATVDRKSTTGDAPGANEASGPRPTDLIGALRAHQIKVKGADGLETTVTGRGIKVGIVDTGIDYTHKMFGGIGTEAAYKSIDPNVLPALGYPNAQVVGGIDLVGTDFNAASADAKKQIPIPDANPLDEGGHGSHVAGTVAGHGDDVKTYTGVAPDALLYSLKVFGADGSTSDSTVVAAFEFAADPNKDGDLSDQLDVLNLSLGSDYGYARGYYSEAIANLNRSNMVVVIASGNSGNFDFVTGSPGVNEEALSVAASIDNSDANIKFGAVAIESADLGRVVSERVEASTSKPIKEIAALKETFVDAGFADQDFSAELAAKVKGHIALIKRGKVAFVDKLKCAEAAGAVGAVVFNNADGAAFVMGGEGKVGIPAVMISKALGERVQTLLATQSVSIEFTIPDLITKPELVDTITDFSSKGPRSGDSRLKPEISAPGQNILSADMGKGDVGVRFSGTSMATPHMAGCAALVKQARPELNPVEIKSLLMGRSLPLKEKISHQGAGRVQVDRAILSPIVILPEALSLGNVQASSRKTLTRSLTLRNLTDVAQDLKVRLESRSPGLKLISNDKVKLGVQGSESSTVEVNLGLVIDVRKQTNPVEELEGWIVVSNATEDLYRVAVLAVVKKLSDVKVEKLQVLADNEQDAQGSAALVSLKNSGAHAGQAMMFNFLGFSPRKANSSNRPEATKLCDLQAAGYRIINKEVDGQKMPVLQVVGKFYEAVTSFNRCELSVLIDADGDGKPEQELAAINLDNVSGFTAFGKAQDFSSVLLDFGKMRQIRAQAEKDALDPKNKVEIDYKSALIAGVPFKPLAQSTVLSVETPLSALKRTASGALSIQVASIDLADDVVGDDFLIKQDQWSPLSFEASSQSFMDLPETVALKAGESKLVRITKGQASTPLMVLFPENRSVVSDVLTDDQMLVIEPTYSNDEVAKP
jgi:minor extracellular serine protease Vpr